MIADRIPGILLAATILVHGTFVLLNLRFPGWRLVDLDQERNLPTYFQTALLAAAALASLDALRLEARLLARDGRRRAFAVLTWLGAALLFAFLATDESLQIHEHLNTDEVRAWLEAASPLQSTVVWLFFLFPGIVLGVGGLVVWLAARAAVSPGFARWGGWALALWIAALVLEGTAKPVFIPRDLYALEVILEESAEALGSALFLCAVWRYRAELRARLRGGGAAAVAPIVAVPWRRVIVTTAVALGAPALLVAAAVLLNPQARHKATGDAHLRAGRFDEAAQAYRAAVRLAPGWPRAWDRLGVAEFRRGDLAAAERAFAAAERLEPGRATPANHRGAVLIHQGRFAEAALAFARAAALEPRNAEAYRNLGIALTRLGRDTEADAVFRRAESLGLSRLGVTALQVSLAADAPLAYVADPRLGAALDHTRAGRVDAALAAYRRALEAAPDLAASHLGLANELLRTIVGRRLTRGRVPAGARDADIDPVRPGVLFTNWIRRADGGWEEFEATVAAEALDGPAGGGLAEAREHYERTLALGLGAPAHLGLALLGAEEGRRAEAASHLATARQLDPRLPVLAATEPRAPGSPTSSGAPTR